MTLFCSYISPRVGLVSTFESIIFEVRILSVAETDFYSFLLGLTACFLYYYIENDPDRVSFRFTCESKWPLSFAIIESCPNFFFLRGGFILFFMAACNKQLIFEYFCSLSFFVDPSDIFLFWGLPLLAPSLPLSRGTRFLNFIMALLHSFFRGAVLFSPAPAVTNYSVWSNSNTFFSALFACSFLFYSSSFILFLSLAMILIFL